MKGVLFKCSVLRFILLLVLFSCLISCSKSVESDAKDAYRLVQESKQAAKDYKLNEAAKYYDQYEKIKNKYKDSADYESFKQAYRKYENDIK